MKKIIIDGKNAVLGRLASYSAKESLKGNEIIIVNSNNVIITGNVEGIREKYLRRRKLGGSSRKGMRQPTNPERILKKTIERMLPKSGRGVEALKRIRCYNEIPKNYEESDKIKTSNEIVKGVSLKKIAQLIK